MIMLTWWELFQEVTWGPEMLVIGGPHDNLIIREVDRAHRERGPIFLGYHWRILVHEMEEFSDILSGFRDNTLTCGSSSVIIICQLGFSNLEASILSQSSHADGPHRRVNNFTLVSNWRPAKLNFTGQVGFPRYLKWATKISIPWLSLIVK